MEHFTPLYGVPVEALAAILAGLLILLWPRLLNYTIAGYLLLVGALGLAQAWYGHGIRPQALIALIAGVLILVRPTILNYVVGVYLILLGLLEAGVVRW
jgi:membrane-bound ClpP family serine protease